MTGSSKHPLGRVSGAASQPTSPLPLRLALRFRAYLRPAAPRRHRPHQEQPRRLAALGLLLRQGRSRRSARPIRARSCSRDTARAGGRVQRVLEGLPRRSGRRAGGRATPRPAASCASASIAATRCSTPAATGSARSSRAPTRRRSSPASARRRSPPPSTTCSGRAGAASSLRPDNFDELVAERYGSAFGPGRNPYPRPGEDPNRTNGGTGRLPEMFTQLRNPDGKWSGRDRRHLPRAATAARRTASTRRAAAAASRSALLLRDAAAARLRGVARGRSPT